MVVVYRVSESNFIFRIVSYQQAEALSLLAYMGCVVNIFKTSSRFEWWKVVGALRHCFPLRSLCCGVQGSDLCVYIPPCSQSTERLMICVQGGDPAVWREH
jgi:hypothetical protein